MGLFSNFPEKVAGDEKLRGKQSTLYRVSTWKRSTIIRTPEAPSSEDMFEPQPVRGFATGIGEFLSQFEVSSQGGSR